MTCIRKSVMNTAVPKVYTLYSLYWRPELIRVDVDNTHNTSSGSHTHDKTGCIVHRAGFVVQHRCTFILRSSNYTMRYLLHGALCEITTAAVQQYRILRYDMYVPAAFREQTVANSTHNSAALYRFTAVVRIRSSRI